MAADPTTRDLLTAAGALSGAVALFAVNAVDTDKDMADMTHRSAWGVLSVIGGAVLGGIVTRGVLSVHGKHGWKGLAASIAAITVANGAMHAAVREQFADGQLTMTKHAAAHAAATFLGTFASVTASKHISK
jgi:hypothetical protein